jgi:hypothetical protein
MHSDFYGSKVFFFKAGIPAGGRAKAGWCCGQLDAPNYSQRPCSVGDHLLPCSGQPLHCPVVLCRRARRASLAESGVIATGLDSRCWLSAVCCSQQSTAVRTPSCLVAAPGSCRSWTQAANGRSGRSARVSAHRMVVAVLLLFLPEVFGVRFPREVLR